jgi:hypothetical protein
MRTRIIQKDRLSQTSADHFIKYFFLNRLKKGCEIVTKEIKLRNGFIVIVILFSGRLTCDGQNLHTENLIWNSVTSTNVATHDTFSQSCTFKTNPNSSVEMIQKGGAMVYNFSITETIGLWSDVTKDGFVKYKVSGSSNGEIDFSRSGEQTKIEMRLVDGGQVIFHYSFSINSVSIN